MDDITSSIVARSFTLFLMLGGLAGMLTGLLLILRPDWLECVGKVLNRWISTRRMDRKLESTVRLDPWFYRHRQGASALTLLGAVYVLFYFIAQFDKTDALAGLMQRLGNHPALLEWLLDAVVLASLIGAMFAAFVSLFLMFRPSQLREFEQAANQWLSLRRALKPLEMPRSGLDEYVLHNARWVGVLLILGGLYAVLGLMFTLE